MQDRYAGDVGDCPWSGFDALLLSGLLGEYFDGVASSREGVKAYSKEVICRGAEPQVDGEIERPKMRPSRRVVTSCI